MASLYRTDYPKYTTYQSDGFGRDNYILKNNGGLCSEKQRAFQESTQYQMAKFHSRPAPRKQATAFKYPSDGSGRDSYILYNSGGLHASNSPNPLRTFYDSLRKNQPKDIRRFNSSKKRFSHGRKNSNSQSRNSPSFDGNLTQQMSKDFEEWQSWNPAYQSVGMKRLVHHQKMQSDRLSIPRDYRMYYKRWLDIHRHDPEAEQNSMFNGATFHSQNLQKLSPIRKQENDNEYLQMGNQLLSPKVQQAKTARKNGINKKQMKEYQELKNKINQQLLLSGRDGRMKQDKQGSPSYLRNKVSEFPTRVHVAAALNLGNQTAVKEQIRRHKEQVLREIKQAKIVSNRSNLKLAALNKTGINFGQPAALELNHSGTLSKTPKNIKIGRPIGQTPMPGPAFRKESYISPRAVSGLGFINTKGNEMLTGDINQNDKVVKDLVEKNRDIMKKRQSQSFQGSPKNVFSALVPKQNGAKVQHNRKTSSPAMNLQEIEEALNNIDRYERYDGKKPGRKNSSIGFEGKKKSGSVSRPQSSMEKF